MAKYQYLSYFLDENTIVYGGSLGIEIDKLNDISKGDTSNTKRISFHNHSGTHIDFPRHFLEHGKSSSDYPPDFWVFNRPHVIQIEAVDDEIILLNKNLIETIPKETDFLILNTGFFKHRQTERFWKNNPGISPNMAELLKQRCPGLKVLGMDTISLTSYQNRVLGRESHRKFLGDNEILLVEDMDLKNIVTQPIKLMCFPILIKNVDGCPVTIIAEYE
jgi:arylformamidase